MALWPPALSQQGNKRGRLRLTPTAQPREASNLQRITEREEWPRVVKIRRSSTIPEDAKTAGALGLKHFQLHAQSGMRMSILLQIV